MSTTKQPELNILPTELLVNGSELAMTIQDIKRRGGHVWAIETITGHNGQWRLRITWPRPASPIVDKESITGNEGACLGVAVRAKATRCKFGQFEPIIVIGNAFDRQWVATAEVGEDENGQHPLLT